MRLRELDFLRGIAFILVMFSHHPFWEPLWNSAWIAIDLFFVLSGYLVSQLLFREHDRRGKVDPFRFLMRRAFKILPVFYLMMGCTAILSWYGEIQHSPEQFISEMIFVQNYYANIWLHTWSLAVEEHFYFGLCLLVFILAAFKALDKHKLFIGLMVFGILLAAGLRSWNAFYLPYTPTTHLWETHIRMDPLLLGVLLGYLKHYRPNVLPTFSKSRLLFYLIAFALFIPVFIWPVYNPHAHSWGITMEYCGFGLILLLFITDKAINEKLDRYLWSKIVNTVAWMGRYSYAVYVFHLMVLLHVMVWLRDAGLNVHYRVEFLIFFSISLLVGVVVTKLVEQPLLNLRDRWFPKRE